MRISISKSKNSESVYIIKNVVINGKRTSKTVKRLGSIEKLKQEHNLDREGVIAWAKEYAKKLAAAEKNETKEIVLELSTNRQIKKKKEKFISGGDIFLKKVLQELKLSEICHQITSIHQFKFDLTAMISELICTRILIPTLHTNKNSTELSKNLLSKANFHMKHISHALDIIAKEKDMVESTISLVHDFLEKKLNNQYPLTDILSTLQNMNFLHYEGNGYIPIYTRTDLTDDLHDILGHRTDTEIVSERKMKKILKDIQL